MAALELKRNCHIRLCLHSNICKYRPIKTKLGHNIYNCKISDEFDYGLTWTGTNGVICPWITKNMLYWTLFTL